MSLSQALGLDTFLVGYLRKLKAVCQIEDIRRPKNLVPSKANHGVSFILTQERSSTLIKVIILADHLILFVFVIVVFLN